MRLIQYKGNILIIDDVLIKMQFIIFLNVILTMFLSCFFFFFLEHEDGTFVLNFLADWSSVQPLVKDSSNSTFINIHDG